jgi:restriction system protein
MVKRYYKLMLGAKSSFADICYNGHFIGADFDIIMDISASLFENWRDFNEKFIPIFLQINPTKSKIAAGLSCGALWTICKGMKIGDLVISPNGSGNYFVGEITSDYFFVENGVLPHRRQINWFNAILEKESLSDTLRGSMGSSGTVCEISRHSDEIERLISGTASPQIISNDNTIESINEFALEKHLEDFLVKNWKQTELGKDYDIYQEDGELVGQQYPTDTGPIDLLAISKDKKTILVVELKKGRVSDHVVGQIQRYMGYVKLELCEPNQSVKGVIIGLEDDLKIKRALSVTTNIAFYRYQISFKLVKG